MKRATLFSLALGLSTLASPARTKISDRDAVRAIIGEGANQCDAALAGIASAIHNRGNLRGVYGLTNPIVDTASDALWARARRAWALGIGIEIDMHFKPQTLAACRAALESRAN